MAATVDRSSSFSPTADVVYPHETKDVQNGDSKEFASTGEKNETGVNEISPEYTRGSEGEDSAEVLSRKQRRLMLYSKYKWVLHLAIWIVWTG
jgi:hypothetical protein